jgi:hypothetical protein
VLPEPAAFDREVKTGLGATAVLLRERPVDQFEIDAAPASKSDRCNYRSPGHHVDGGSLAEIFVGCSATKWLRLSG